MFFSWSCSVCSLLVLLSVYAWRVSGNLLEGSSESRKGVETACLCYLFESIARTAFHQRYASLGYSKLVYIVVECLADYV